MLEKKQRSERYYEVAFPFRCAACMYVRICLWPLGRDTRSGVLIGASGRRRSDWPARVLATDISTRIDRKPALVG